MTTRDRASRLGDVLDAHARLEPPRGGSRLVVIDDGSTDATPSVLASRLARAAAGSLVVVRTPPLGMNGARNRVLDGLVGDLVVFTDDDTIPRADWLVRLRDAADAHPEVEVIACTVRPRFEVAPPAFVLRAIRPGPAFAWVDRPADGLVDPTEAVGPSLAIRTSRFAAGLRFDETMGPDGSDNYPMGAETELLLRLQRAGVKAWFACDAIVEHHMASAQCTEDALLRRAFRFGRGRWRLGTARLAARQLRVRGLPLALLADLMSRRLALAYARRRGDAEAMLRAAWRIAYLAGHVAEVRHERGHAASLGPLAAWVPEPVRAALAPLASRPGAPPTHRAPARAAGVRPVVHAGP